MTERIRQPALQPPPIRPAAPPPGPDQTGRGRAQGRHRGGNRRGHLANSGAGQHDLLASQLADVEFATGQAQLFDVAHLGSQQGNFLVHRTYDAYFHGVLASGSVDE